NRNHRRGLAGLRRFWRFPLSGFLAKTPGVFARLALGHGLRGRAVFHRLRHIGGAAKHARCRRVQRKGRGWRRTGGSLSAHLRAEDSGEFSRLLEGTVLVGRGPRGFGLLPPYVDGFAGESAAEQLGELSGIG